MNNKVIKNINIDFDIVDVYNPKYITIIDRSEWGGILKKPSIIEVSIPAQKNKTTHYFDKNGVTELNSLNLGLNCGDCGEELFYLPDGIYEVTIKGSPDKYKKSKRFLKSTQAKLELDKMVMSHVSTCSDIDNDFLNRLNKIKALIRSAEANVRYDNRCEAQELFFKAQDLIKKTKNGCS